jgi:DNA-directed RNA polymerase specialized sigma subunit
MENNLSREELYELIKQAVRDVLREENIKLKPNSINDVETVSQEEMEDIINTHGKPSDEEEIAYTEEIEL